MKDELDGIGSEVSMLDLAITGGLVVLPDSVGLHDIGVRRETVVAITTPGELTGDARATIDAAGKVVVPGGIDPHVHVNMPLSASALPRSDQLRSQGPEATSRACAFGGTTTVVDFAGFPAAGDPLESIAVKHDEWAGDSYIDYSFHCTLLGEVPFEYIEQIPEVIGQGVTSFKVFTRTWPVGRQPSPRVDDGRIAEIMRMVAKHRGALAVHAENDGILSFNVEKLIREGRNGIENVALAHDSLCEEIEIQKLIHMAERTGATIYCCHVSAKEAVEAIREARERGIPIYGETLHNYLAFTADDLKQPDGAKYLTHPGQKYKKDQEALWAGLVEGAISTLATDELTTQLATKLAGKTVAEAVGGHNGVETRLPYAFSEGVSKKRLSLERFVEITSTNAAKILGMYPRKGAIAPGSDADIVVIDPNMRKRVTLEHLHADSDYSIWDGWEFRGWPVATILRGKVITEGGKLVGALGDGKFVRREASRESAPVTVS